MEYILKVDNLEKRYKKSKVINNLNMNIPKGAIYGLIGRNGAGKTTLIRLICGLQNPSSGIYSVYGIQNTDKKIYKARKRMGAIIEQPSIYTSMTAKDNLIEQYKVIGIPFDNYIKELLDLVKLSDTGQKKVKHFSLGMKQRLGIALALIGHPDFLILDEPINGLDPEGIIDIRELILKLNRENGITFLISSHYLDELSKIATHYGFMNNGKIVKEITKNEFENNCKKRIELTVSNIKKCVRYLEENKISYKVISSDKINIYDSINITDLVNDLSALDCKINDFHEREASLESYYINLIGGNENV